MHGPGDAACSRVGVWASLAELDSERPRSRVGEWASLAELDSERPRSRVGEWASLAELDSERPRSRVGAPCILHATQPSLPPCRPCLHTGHKAFDLRCRSHFARACTQGAQQPWTRQGSVTLNTRSDSAGLANSKGGRAGLRSGPRPGEGRQGQGDGMPHANENKELKMLLSTVCRTPACRHMPEVAQEHRLGLVLGLGRDLHGDLATRTPPEP